jgi:hypothetical protein
MRKNWRMPDMSKFCVFIFSWGNPGIDDTLNTLRNAGYTGPIIHLLDDLDPTREEYIRKYGKENCYVFNKHFVARRCDAMNNFGGLESTLYVEHAMFDAAKELGYDYFVSMCHDYYYLGHRGENGAKRTKRINEVFELMVEFLINSKVKCVAFSQGGDNMGGFSAERLCKRKVMNSFFCKTSEPFPFYGSMNDDCNMYVRNGIKGDVFLTIMRFQLDQGDTQSNDDGLANLYKSYGTYVKSFYTVMLSPSSVKVALMGTKSTRLHHRIDYKKTVPCILSYKYKKQA